MTSEFLLNILSTENSFDLEKPYLRQIIEDTISADLLDYSRRDAYFTSGWGRQWDDRLYDHIAVALCNFKPCLVARISFANEKVTSAITELINLFQIRYMLNERVYFYPTKIAADALLVKSVRCLIKDEEPEIFQKKIKDFSDEELINFLIANTPPEIPNYAQLLKDRNLPGLAESFALSDLPQPQIENVSLCCRGHNRLVDWQRCEDAIAEKAGVSSDKIIVYCHDIAMQKKKPDFLVQASRDSEPYPVAKYEAMMGEIENIAKKHENLWRCYVFSMDRSPNIIDKVKLSAKNVLMALKPNK